MEAEGQVMEDAEEGIEDIIQERQVEVGLTINTFYLHKIETIFAQI